MDTHDDFSRIFVLKQHTPMIHFQSDQSGVTLRATEVKAKLDKFIWNKVWKGNFDSGKTFLVGYSPGKASDLKKRFDSEGFRALNYKIRFVAGNTTVRQISEKSPLYFGNMGEDGEQKKAKEFVQSSDNIHGTIFSMNCKLLEVLTENLHLFFQMENFGTRQNKGFGSFEVVSINGNSCDRKSPSDYYFDLSSGQDFNGLLENIDLFYRTLRSGINLKAGGGKDKLYFKSLLFQYAKKQNHQWDKREIRLKLFRNHPKFQEVGRNRTESDGTVNYKTGEPKLYRDMLGLSSSQSWLSYSKATVEKTSVFGVDRYKSPITFKPFKTKNGWRVYIIPGIIPHEMENSSFKIKSGREELVMFTPEKFELEAYLKFAFSYFESRDITVEDYVGEHIAPREVKILENIYQQLSEQVKQ